MSLSSRQFSLLHQVTKEIPRVDEAGLDVVGCPAAVARRLPEIVRLGRAGIGDHPAVRIGFDDDATALEVRRPVTTRSRGDALEIDSGTTTAAARAWQAAGRYVIVTLGTPEVDLRTGGTAEDAEAVLTLLAAVSQPGQGAPAGGPDG